MLTPTNPLLLICMIRRAIFLPAVASGELREQSKPWELVYPLAGCSVPTGRGPRGWGVVSCSLKHGKALEERFGTRNLLSSPSTINKSKPGFIPVGCFILLHTRGEVLLTSWTLLHHWQCQRSSTKGCHFHAGFQPPGKKTTELLENSYGNTMGAMCACITPHWCKLCCMRRLGSAKHNMNYLVWSKRIFFFFFFPFWFQRKETHLRTNLKFIHQFKEAISFTFVLAKYASII